MRRQMLIKVLEILERESSYVDTKTIARELKLDLNGELLQIVNYLSQSKKVELLYKNHLPVMINGTEKLKLQHTGVDFLTDLRSLRHKEKSESLQYEIAFSVGVATIVLALAAFIDIGIKLILNGRNLLVLLGTSFFTALIVFFLILFGFMAFLILKSYKMLHKED